MEFAKHPSEDALRRDFTMNALYYNLNTKEVEDFTGTGLEDLENGIVRTPLPAAKTFVDDPLRVLRAIRFATRFGFKLDSEIVAAWAHEDVRSGLMNKVSRERVGIEVTKMMKNEHALSAIGLLLESGLMELILTPPTEPDAPSLAGVSVKDFAEWNKVWSSVTTSSIDTDSLIARSRTVSFKITKDQEIYVHNLALLFSRLIGSGNPALVCRLSMKLSTSDSKSVGAVLAAVPDIRSLAEKLATEELTASDAAASVGRLIRSGIKELFPVALRVALVTDSSLRTCDDVKSAVAEVERVVSEFQLENCHTWKPVVDGAELASLFGLKGPKIQEALYAQFDFMFLGVRDRATILSALDRFSTATS